MSNCRFKGGSMELKEIRQLLDLDTEEARQDLWTRFQLTPGEAVERVFQSSSHNRESSVHPGGSPSSRKLARTKPDRRP